MTKLLRRIRDDDGATLPLVALMLTALMGITAFGVDLGWIYLNAARVQRAADAGALAGVIRMPTDFPQATTDAKAITRTNGYEDGQGNVVVTTAQVPGEPNQLDVIVTDTIPTFFAHVFGIDQVTITRTARGEFIPALKLGSPDNQFGNSCDPNEPGCSGQSNFWANIHGKHTDTVMGDAYSSACRGSSGNPGCTANALWRERGYLYGVEANGAASFTVEFNDLAFHNTSGGVTTNDNWRTGDRGCEAWGNNNASCGPTMRVSLYAPDADPLDITNNTLLCQQDVAPQPQVPESDPYSFASPKGCFTVVSPGSGIYIVQVKVLDTGGNDDGLNRYAIRSVPSGTSLFGLGDFSIYNNASGSTTAFYLAKVDQFYAGKTFVVELYDPGESSQTGNLQVIQPGGGVFTGSCRIYSRNTPADNWTLQSTPGTCAESVTPGEYNGRWLKFEMDIPSSYTCGTCWWKMNYAYPSAVNDTTTWRAYIIGNPIHLVPSP